MTNDIDTRDDKVVLSRVLDRALMVKLDVAALEIEKLQAEVEQLNESLAQAKGEIERLMSVSRYEERESSDAKAEVERLKDVLRIKGYREACPIPGCNCGEHGWIHGGYADDRLREIHDALDDDFQGKTLLDAVIALNSHSWEQERAAVVAWLTKRYEDREYMSVVRTVTKLFAGRIERGEHWTEGGAQ